ncbi:MAG: ABC transporter permease, partial [Tidjanibacter sp.]|nr:ABC transporter permease [Tidjanibacter sp.]
MKKLVSRTGLLTSTITDELRAISRSAPIVLVILGGVVGYGVLYNLLYRPNVVERVAVVVVDDSQSATSRRLTTLIGASPKVEIVGHLPDLAEARRAMADQSAEGIIY